MLWKVLKNRPKPIFITIKQTEATMNAHVVCGVCDELTFTGI